MKKRKSAFLLTLATSLTLLAGCTTQIDKAITPVETGELSVQVGEAIPLQSVGTTLTLDRVEYGDPDYGTMTIDLAMYLVMDVPNPEKYKPYTTWLSDFTVNGTPVDHEVGTEVMGHFLSLASSTVYRADTIIYKVPYTASEEDESFQITCKASDSLSLSWTSDKGFWDIDSVDEMDAKAYQRSQEEGVPIKAVYAKDLINEELVTGEMYMVTGVVSYSGKGLLDKTYTILYASGDRLAYLYFTKDTIFREGDTVTIFGRFDERDFFGHWNFKGCFI